MVEKDRTKILKIIICLIVLLALILSGCITKDSSNNENQEQDNEKKWKLHIDIYFKEFIKLNNGSSLYEP